MEDLTESEHTALYLISVIFSILSGLGYFYLSAIVLNVNLTISLIASTGISAILGNLFGMMLNNFEPKSGGENE